MKSINRMFERITKNEESVGEVSCLSDENKPGNNNNALSK